MAVLRKRLLGIGASLLVVGLIAPPADVARATTAQGAVVTPEILTISPSSGPVTGGDTITITGTDLDAVPFDPYIYAESSVFFGTTNDVGGVAARILSRTATSMTVIVPRSVSPGPVNVTLVTNAVRVTRDAGYTYTAPSFTSITPAASPTAGGVSVTIKGVGFGYPWGGVGGSYVSSVTIGGVGLTSLTRTNPTTITGTAPANAVVGAKDVVVTVNPTSGAPIVISSTGAFSYVLTPTAPTIAAIAPPNGPTAGGNTVKITGTNFRGSDGNPATVTIGGNSMTGVTVAGDNKSIDGTVPAGTVGKVNVVVQTSDGRATLVGGYEYAPAPTMSSVAPASGPIEGGARITITGSNFGAAGNPAVTVGGVAAICVALVSPTTITAVVPAGAAGAADVTVTLDNGGGSATLTGAYTYASATLNPSVTSITPGQGTAAGGTTVTFAGSGLGGASATVLVNGKCATDVAGSASSMTAKVPAGTVGWAEVKIATATGTLTIPASEQRFRYVDITTISPANGPTTGGTVITISGSGFGSSTAPAVTIGGAAATVSSFSDTSITVTAPPGATGKRDVVVTPSTGGLLTKVGGFTYVAPSVTSVTPNSGIVTGGNTVTIVGTGFGNTGTPNVTFGGTAATSVVRQSNTQLTAVVPARATAGTVAVSVTPAVGTGTGTLENAYTYAPAVRTPLIDNVSPDRGPNTGGTTVTVLGANFRGSNNTPATVTLGGQSVTGLSVNSAGTSLTFTTPALSMGYAQLRITTNEGSAVYYYAFISVGPPVAPSGCLAVSPRGTVYYTGSNSVTVTGTGFGETGTATVTVNGTSATVTSSSDTAVTFTIPNIALGLLDISVTPTNGGPPLVLNDCISLKRLLTITAVTTPSSINYGASSATFSFTTSGLQPGHAVSGVTYYFEGIAPTNYPYQTTTPTNAGTYRIYPSSATFSSGSASNYDINYVPTSYTINGLPATVTPNNKTITFGSDPGTFTSSVTGLRAGEALGSVTYTFTNAYYSSTTVPTEVGTYTITPTVNSLSPGNVGNYSFTANTGTFTINRKPVTVSAAAKTKAYGADDPALTYSTSPTTSLNGELTRNSGENVGSYTITQGSITNENNPNYEITYTSANLSITPVTVTVTADAQSKVYGESDPDFTYTASPDVPLSGSLSRITGENVAQYNITQGSVTSNSNYTVVFVSAKLTISKAEITIQAQDKYSTYGDARPTNSIEVTDGSLRSGESISSVTYTYSPTASPTNAGSYTITPSAAVISGGLASNYDISYDTGTLEISPKTVTVTPNSGQTKVFGASNPTYLYSLSEAISVTGALSRDSGEDVDTYLFDIGTLEPSSANYALELGGSVTFAITKKPVTVTPNSGQTKAYGASNPTYAYTTSPTTTLVGDLDRAVGENVSTYAFTIGTLSDYNPNYQVTLTPGVTFAITPATVTVTPTSGQSKTYDDDDPELAYSASPDVELSGSLSRVAGENVGQYNITQGSITSTSNYTVVFTAGVKFTIDRMPVTVTADDKEKDFGAGDPTLTYTTEPVVTLTGTLSRASGTNVGDYNITQGTVTNANNANYDIDFVVGTLTINPVTVTVTPNSSQTKVYGASNPTYTYTLSQVISVTGALSRESGEDVDTYDFTLGTLASSSDNYTLELVSGKTFAITRKPVAVTAATKTKVYGEDDPEFTFTTSPTVTLSGDLSRNTGEDVGSYPITQGSVTNDNNPNYNISFTGANMSITPATVTVTPDADQFKTYGDSNPTLSYSTSPTVTLSGSLGRAIGENVGQYNITQGSVTSTSNYTVQFTSGVKFTIDPIELTITAVDKEITFGESLPSNSFTVDGTPKSGESVSLVSYAYSPTASPSDAGSYTITPSNAVIAGGSASNYDITYETGTLTIEQKSVTVTPDSGQSKIYGDSDPVLTYTLSENIGAMSGSLTQPGTNVGNHPISIGSLTPVSDNYTLTFTTGVTFEIVRKDVSVVALQLTKVFGEDDPDLDFQVSPSGIDLNGALAREQGEDVDFYDITQGTVTNTSNPNYNIISFTPSTLEITKADVTVTPTSGQKKNVGADEPTALTYTAVPNAPLEGNLSRAIGENVGEYEIQQGTLLPNNNYSITFTTGVKFEITKRAITVRAEDKDSTFGDASLPTNTFVVSEGELLAGDSLAGASADYGPTTPPTDAGTYTITPKNAVLTIGASSSLSNYEISYEAGTLTIEPKPVTITANGASTQFGQDAPTFTSSASGLLTPDALSSTGFSFSGNGYGPSSTPPTAPGTYDVAPATPVALSPGDSDNYEFEFVSAEYTISGSEIGSLVPIQGTYLGSTPFTISGFGLGKPGDNVVVTFGGIPATDVVVVDYRTIKGLTPPFTLAEEYVGELVDVEVTTEADSNEILLELAYTYLPPRPTPLVQALSPDLGPRQGRTLLTIAGSNLTGSDGVKPTILVDGNPTTEVTVATDGKSVSAKTPPGEVDDPKDVELFTNEGAVAFLGAYTYFTPTITDITPDVLYEIGSIDDETVVITGTGFGDTTPVVKVGGVSIPVTAHTPTSITLVMPPRTPGIYDVQVIPEGDVGVTESEGFEFVQVPSGDVDGLIWLDLDKNGAFDEASDPIFPSLPLTLTLNQYLLAPPTRTPRSATVRSMSAATLESSSGSERTVEVATPVTYEILTDENGRYDFTKLPYGKYTLTYQLPGDVTTTYEPEDAVGGVLFIRINKPEFTANVGGVGQSTLHARVREKDGTLYPDTPFWMRWWGTDRQFNTPDDVIILTTTDSESMVEFIGNLPSGRYRVEVPGGGYLAKVTTTLDLLPVSSLTGSEFIFRKPSAGKRMLAMLPDTGAGIAGLMLSASVLIFGGGAMVASDRRRRRVRTR